MLSPAMANIDVIEILTHTMPMTGDTVYGGRLLLSWLCVKRVNLAVIARFMSRMDLNALYRLL